MIGKSVKKKQDCLTDRNVYKIPVDDNYEADYFHDNHPEEFMNFSINTNNNSQNFTQLQNKQEYQNDTNYKLSGINPKVRTRNQHSNYKKHYKKLESK